MHACSQKKPTPGKCCVEHPRPPSFRSYHQAAGEPSQSMPADPSSPARSEPYWQQLQNCRQSPLQREPQPGRRSLSARTFKLSIVGAYNECTNEVLDLVWTKRRIRLGQLCKTQGSFALGKGTLLKQCLLLFKDFGSGRRASNVARLDGCYYLLRLGGLFAGSDV